MLQDHKIFIKESLSIFLNEQISVVEPKDNLNGDLSVPLFNLSKKLNKDILVLFDLIKNKLCEFDFIDSVELKSGFLNIYFKRDLFSKKLFEKFNKEKKSFPIIDFGFNKTVVIDYSSPNIAKSFSIGHLRSTMIGHSLKKIYQRCGYKAIGINYLGDWGTQFGKMIVAFNKWLDKDNLDKNPIQELTRLYVLFHEKSLEDPTLEEEARKIFLEIENKNEKYLKLWSWIKDLSLLESKQIYDLLDISFDSYNGESYYNDKMDFVIDMLNQKGIARIDDGALIVDLEGLPPALIKRSDGASLYITRDLAAIFDRYNTYRFDKILYVVGNEQKLHFKQLRSVVQKLGYEDISKNTYHVGFGLYLKDKKKISTRSGHVVKLYDVLDESIKLVKSILEDKKEIKNISEISKRVGLSAIIFNDLKNYRELDIEFDLNKALQFEGQTGPYLLYSIVRINSILKNSNYDFNNVDFTLFKQDNYYNLSKLIDSYSDIIIKAHDENSPSYICRYLLDLAQEFNKFYSNQKINHDDIIIKNTNFLLISAIKHILVDGIRLLGIKEVDEM